MAGQNGYSWIVDRVFEDLPSLKKHARLQGRVQEVRFAHVTATGGAGATIEIEEKTGTTVTYLAAEAQAYIRGHTDNAAYDGKTMTLSWLDDAGVIHDPVTTTFNADTTIEVIVAGAADYYRSRPGYPTSNAVIQVGHTLSIGDDNHANDGSGNDLWGVIEEGNYNSIHSRYFVPSEDSAGKTVYSYIGKLLGKYSAPTTEHCTLTVTCTPYNVGYETTMAFTIFGGVPLDWQEPFRLKAATDVKFTVADDAATGGNFEFEYIIVEVTRLV